MVRPTYQSFRLLQRLEWLLLATAMVMEVLMPLQLSWAALFRVSTIGLFGAVGFLPTDSVALKVALYSTVFWLAFTASGAERTIDAIGVSVVPCASHAKLLDLWSSRAVGCFRLIAAVLWHVDSIDSPS